MDNLNETSVFEQLDSRKSNDHPHCSIKHSSLGGADYRVSLVEIKPIHNAETIQHSLTSELVYVLTGKMLATIGGLTKEVSTGGLVFIPKNTDHSFRCIADSCEFIVVHTPNINFYTDHKTLSEQQG